MTKMGKGQPRGSYNKENRIGHRPTKAELTWDLVESLELYLSAPEPKGESLMADVIECLDKWRDNPIAEPKHRIGRKKGLKI